MMPMEGKPLELKAKLDRQMFFTSPFNCDRAACGSIGGRLYTLERNLKSTGRLETDR
jgi:hypothetical protein